jgi:hypothetical protein
MQLRNPGGLEQAIETVKQVKGQLMSTVAGSSAQRKDAFLTWCDQWATPQLGNHFPRSEGIFAEVADSYHRIDSRSTARHLVVRDGEQLLADTQQPLA